MNTIKDLIAHIRGNYKDEGRYDRVIRKMGDLIKKSEKQNIKLNEIFSCFNKENLIYFQKSFLQNFCSGQWQFSSYPCFLYHNIRRLKLKNSLLLRFLLSWTADTFHQ